MFLRKPFRYEFKRFTLVLIAVNFIVFALQCLSGEIAYWIKVLGAMIPRLIIQNKFIWTFFTYMFIHADFTHIFFNMIGLYMFGIHLERAIGSKEFRLFYFTCGILSGVLSFVYYYFNNVFSISLIGASGAIYAVMFGFAVCYPRAIIRIWGIIPVPAPILVIIYTFIELYYSFSGRSSNVAHYTHLFGLLTAYLYFVIRMGIHPIKIWKNNYR